VLMSTAHNPSGSISLAAVGFSACGSLVDMGLETEGRSVLRSPSKTSPIAVQPGRPNPSQGGEIITGAVPLDPSGIPIQSGSLLPSNFWVDDGSILEKEGRPVQLAIPHFRQQYNWDCGVACVRMILRWECLCLSPPTPPPPLPPTPSALMICNPFFVVAATLGFRGVPRS
jgi:hypothetical protein